MNPVTRLYRRSRAFRVLLYLLMVPFWALLQFVCADSLAKYSHVGNITLILLIMLFGLWAWWYDEDRTRRAAAKAAAQNGGAGSNGHVGLDPGAGASPDGR